jgi:exodeoxyribonuclease VII large subunit
VKSTTPDGETSQTLSVSQLNRQAKSLLEGHFNFVWVGGEISNFAAPSSGHWYFTLKDGNAQVRCAMFRSSNQRLRFTPEQGDEVRVRCRVSLYEGRGEFQLIVEHMELSGEGALQAAFEKLKHKLQAEGLFDSDGKRPMPEHISSIGVITSPTGAAIHDILTVLERRCPSISVVLIPVPVQGEGAAGAISNAISLANRANEKGITALDALIVGRGGGSLEDLWAFNEEIVARAIAQSKLPIVSAVGHEVDFSIADFVADTRAATPSAAAELLSPDVEDWLQQLAGFKYQLEQQLRHKLSQLKVEFRHLRQRLQHPGSRLREQAQRIDDLEQRLVHSKKAVLQRLNTALDLKDARLRANSPGPAIATLKSREAELERRLHSAMQQRLEDKRIFLGSVVQLLDSLSPLAVLSRGYAIITDNKGNVLKNSNSVQQGDEVEAKLAEGRLRLTVQSID